MLFLRSKVVKIENIGQESGRRGISITELPASVEKKKKKTQGRKITVVKVQVCADVQH